jgi:hypothetical protein
MNVYLYECVPIKILLFKHVYISFIILSYIIILTKRGMIEEKKSINERIMCIKAMLKFLNFSAIMMKDFVITPCIITGRFDSLVQVSCQTYHPVKQVVIHGRKDSQ